MTFDDLAQALAVAPPDAQLRMTFDGAAPPPGLHVTEIRRAAVQSIDCGARRDAWEEAVVQLLFGDGEMTVGAAAGILKKSRAALTGIGPAQVRVEAAPEGPLSLFALEAVDISRDAATLRMTAERPLCKPARDFAAARASAAPAGRCC